MVSFVCGQCKKTECLTFILFISFQLSAYRRRTAQYGLEMQNPMARHQRLQAKTVWR